MVIIAIISPIFKKVPKGGVVFENQVNGILIPIINQMLVIVIFKYTLNPFLLSTSLTFIGKPETNLYSVSLKAVYRAVNCIGNYQDLKRQEKG